MSHQSNPTTLRRTVEDSNLRAVRLERIGVVHGCCVGVWMYRLTVSWLIGDLCHAITVNTNFVAVNDFETRLISLAEEPGMVSVDSQRFTHYLSHIPKSFPHHSISLLVDKQVVRCVRGTGIVPSRAGLQHQRHDVQFEPQA